VLTLYFTALAKEIRYGKQRMTTKVGRNDPCPCGSGKKFKKCHEGVGFVEKPIHVQDAKKPITAATIPRDKLGLPGAAYQCWVRMLRRGEDRNSQFVQLQDNYRVVFTLDRNVADIQNLSFESGVPGDSYIAFTKPEHERSETDPEEMVIFSAHIGATGIRKLEITGKANPKGRLGKLLVDVPAASFPDAEDIAFREVSPFLSVLSFELDIPVRLAQLDVTQTSTQNVSMNYVCPFPDMVPTGIEQNNLPYIQSLLSLYREGINSNSPNYQFLCWYKMVEGINDKRASDTAALKSELPKKFPERLSESAIEQRKRFAEIFPAIGKTDVADQNYDHIVPEEARGWKFNRVREKNLEPLRNKIAHMLSEPSGDLSLSPDSRQNTREVVKWLSCLRFIARVMTMNEDARLPKPQPAFSKPKNAKTMDELRRGIMAQ